MGHQKRFQRYSDEDRRSWQDPEAILGLTGLKSGDVFVDVGCGYGFFAIPAARIVGPHGKVIGIDVDRDWLESLRVAATNEGITNVETLLGRAEEIVPLEGSADVVFLGMDLHDFDDPAAVLRNARRTLKGGGTLANLDWKKEESPIGPPPEIRLDAATEAAMISGEGFEVMSVTAEGPYHYLILARPR